MLKLKEIDESIYRALNENCNALETYAGKYVESLAVPIYMYGYKRSALPETKFFLHRAVSNSAADGNEERVRDTENKMVRFLSIQSGTPESVFWDLMNNNATIDAKQARELGIVNSDDPYPSKVLEYLPLL